MPQKQLQISNYIANIFRLFEEKRMINIGINVLWNAEHIKSRIIKNTQRRKTGER